MNTKNAHKMGIFSFKYKNVESIWRLGWLNFIKDKMTQIVIAIGKNTENK
jgi:hypothetical protein